MINANEQNAGSSKKPSFQSQSLGPNKVAAAPVAKADAKSEAATPIPNVAPEPTAKPGENKPVLEKQS